MNPASIAVEGVKVAKGKESPTNLVLYILVAAAVEVYLRNKERTIMLDPIYIPAGYEIHVLVILIACALLFPVLAGWFFKNGSKHAGEPWTMRYVSTLFIDMALAPSLSLLGLSLIVQAWFPGMDPVTYLVLLPIVTMFVAYEALKIMNEGIRAAVDQITGVAKETKEAAEELKKL